MAPGSSGTLFSAIFESLGYQYQAYVLDQLTSAFQNEVGAFLYLIGLSAVVFSVAIQGHYKLAPWILLGPPLFFAVILGRTNVTNARWMFAQVPRYQPDVDKEVQRMSQGGAGGGGARGANVSTLFAKYNRLISETAQEMIKVINNEKKQSDRTFILKGQTLAALYSKVIPQSGLSELIQWMLMGECREAVEAARVLEDPQSTDKQKEAANFGEKFDKTPQKPLSTSAAMYIAQVELGGGGSASGSDEYLKELANKVRELQEKPLTCKKIWDYVYKGLLEKGSYEVRQAAKLARRNKIDPDAFLGRIASAMGINAPKEGQAADLSRLSRVVALYMLRNVVKLESKSGLIENKAMLGKEIPRIAMPLESELATTEWARASSTEWAERTRLILSASNLPYYQGLLLFVLATAFPFFALLLLIPGKHPGFLLWFVLWLWVKSWDVAMALVMQLDDILFTLLSLNKANVGGARELEDNFGVMMYLIKELDPSFHLGTYYNIIAVALLSIPVVTSQIILGSLSGGAGLVAAGMSTVNLEFARGAQSTQVAHAISNLRYQMLDNKQDHVHGIQQRLGSRVLSFVHGLGNPYVDTMGSHTRIAERTEIKDHGPHPDARKPLWDPRHLPPVGSSVTPGGKFVYPRSSPLMGSIDDRNRISGWAALVQGLSSSVKNPTTFSLDPIRNITRLFGAGGGSRTYGQAVTDGRIDAVRAAAQGIASVSEILSSSVREALNVSVDEDLKVAAAHGVSDSIYGVEGRRLAFLMRLYGAIEVPVTAEPGDISEAEREQRLELQEIKMYSSFFRAVTEAVSRGEKLGDVLERNGKLREAFERFSSVPGARPQDVNWRSTEFRKWVGGASFGGMTRQVGTGQLPGMGHGP